MEEKGKDTSRVRRRFRRRGRRERTCSGRGSGIRGRWRRRVRLCLDDRRRAGERNGTWTGERGRRSSRGLGMTMEAKEPETDPALLEAEELVCWHGSGKGIYRREDLAEARSRAKLICRSDLSVI